MRCFTRCFGGIRQRHERRRTCRLPNSAASRKQESVASKNQLASLFLREEEDGGQWKSGQGGSNQNAGNDIFLGGLTNEVKFLKPHGETLTSPVELLKSLKEETSHPHCTSPKKLLADEQHDGPSTSFKRMHGNCSLPENISHCVKFEPVQASIENADTTSSQPAQYKAGRCLSGFESDSLQFSNDASPFHPLSQIELAGSVLSPRQSLGLTNEIQTSDIHVNDIYEVTSRDNVRMRSQYVTPVLKPVANLSQWRKLIEDAHRNPRLGDPFEQCSIDEKEKVDPVAPYEEGIDSRQGIYMDEYLSYEHLSSLATSLNNKEGSLCSDHQPLCSDHHSQVVMSSLSTWLDPPPASNEMHCYNEPNKKGTPGQSVEDRPIIGMVAAHWKDDEASRASRKWWYENGIPNSTKKYREDQKVYWNSTPFEERVEQALSDENLNPQRKLLPWELELSELEEDDTAES